MKPSGNDVASAFAPIHTNPKVSCDVGATLVIVTCKIKPLKVKFSCSMSFSSPSSETGSLLVQAPSNAVKKEFVNVALG